MVKSLLSKPIAAWIVYQQRKWMQAPISTQRDVFRHLIQKARHTQFGQDHDFPGIQTYDDFKARVPVVDYEGLIPYIEQIQQGQQDVLWPGKPLYFAKTSGTTSGNKYIPITEDAIPYHLWAARDALLNYIHTTKKAQFLDNYMIFLSGSPTLTTTGDIPTGRLSGIVNHHVPSYLQRNQLPSYTTNCIEDWEEKLSRIVQETVHKKMGLISGIPPWIQLYFDHLQALTGKTIRELFPQLEVLVHGGVNFEPYRDKLIRSLGEPIDMVELYPTSEGFIAFQDTRDEEGLLLLLDSGIFYEFIPAKTFFTPSPTRISLEEVILGVEYVIILNTNAGLWGYNLGDTVRFVSKEPYRLVVTGRIKHFISAFGEHVIAEEVDKAMQHALQQHPETILNEFTVAPYVSQHQDDTPSHHEWLIEFNTPPHDIPAFAQTLERDLRARNIYYNDLIENKALHPLQINPLKQDTFLHYQQKTGKLGGQHKVVRLSNDRTLAEELRTYSKEPQ